MIALRLEWEDGSDHRHEYMEVVEFLRLRERPPEGLLVHTAGVTEAGAFRVFDIWETREHMEAFYETALMPAALALTGRLPVPPMSTESWVSEVLIQA